MASPLLPFSGGLRNQSAYILKAISHFVNQVGAEKIFCDPFFGGGSISFEARLNGYKVYSSDIAMRSVIPARCLIEKNQPLMGIDAAKLFTPIEGTSAINFNQYPRVTEVLYEEFIVAIRTMLLNAITDTEKYVALRAVFELLPMGGFGLMKRAEKSDGALEGWAKCREKLHAYSEVLDKCRNLVNAGIIQLEEQPPGIVTQADAREHITASSLYGASAVHLDPPTYGTKGYTNLYWWLDAMLEDKVVEKDKGFNRVEALGFVQECVACADNIPVVAITQQQVSYPLEDALKVLKDAGRKTSAYEIPVANTVNPFYIAIGVK